MAAFLDGEPADDLTHPEDAPRFQQAVERLLRHDPPSPRHSEPLRLRHAGGQLISCQVYLAAMGQAGRRRQLLCQLHELPAMVAPRAPDRAGPDLTERTVSAVADAQHCRSAAPTWDTLPVREAFHAASIVVD